MKTYFLTPWPTYATNQNHLNNFGRGSPAGTISVEFGQVTISGSREDVVWTFPFIIQWKIVKQFWPQGYNLNNFGRGPLDDAKYQIWKLWALVLDKKTFENCILKTYFWTQWPTYATKWNGLNNFGRGTPKDHSCEVWSKSNERFKRTCLSKKVKKNYGRQTTDKGRSQSQGKRSFLNLHIHIYKQGIQLQYERHT